ncbi:MAG: DUF3410 domain-containing protein [Nitrospirales bacterium]|nr:DUF3410 domain-containing protein [Nitrospirales bacterium]
MKIVLDNNIPFGEEAFSALGDVHCVSGREMSAEIIRDASIVVVRSITKVDAKLLQNSQVRVVGTVTAGIDHIDCSYLAQNHISLTTAFGANANSVAEYVITALLVWAHQYKTYLIGKTLGVIGVGNIGSLVAKKASALGMDVILHDPPLARKTGDAQYRSFDEVCQADFVTLHVPLTRTGPDATYHLFDGPRIAKLSLHVILLNTSRGEVIDNQSLYQAVLSKQIQPPILDVWEGEPTPHWGLVEQAAVATPHIAGHSFDGKIQGTMMVYQAICRIFGVAPTWMPTLPDPEHPSIMIAGKHEREETLLWKIATHVYDLPGDHARMKALSALPLEKRALAFDHLRKTYPRRREFRWTKVLLQDGTAALKNRMTGLGFQVE